MSIKAKICGISSLDAALTALRDTDAPDAKGLGANGLAADLLGFIHFAKSPRHVGLEAMADLVAAVRATGATARLVSVVVDPEDALLELLKTTVKPDLIQLHGKETPQRVADIASRFDMPLIKAISVSGADDLTVATAYEPHVDYMMFDAKLPKEAALPGGMGVSFDWRLMQGYSGGKPWFLAGGLNPGNVAEALRISGAPMVDVSSGVESAPGIKDPQRISDFLKTVKSL